MYLGDNRNFWANSESKSYAWSLARVKYIQNEMPPKKGAYTCCPSIKRDPGQQGKINEFDQSNIQMYASIGTIGEWSDYSGFGMYVTTPGFANGADRIGGEFSKDDVSPIKRIWFADGLRPDTQRQRTLLITESSYTADRPDCARPYAVHGGRINIATHDGSVVSVELENLKDYYLPYLYPEPRSYRDPKWAYSVRANTYNLAERSEARADHRVSRSAELRRGGRDVAFRRS